MPRTAVYLIVRSTVGLAPPGVLVRSKDVGEVAYMRTLDPNTMKEKTVAVAIRVGVAKPRNLIKRLTVIAKNPERYAVIAGVEPEEVTDAAAVAIQYVKEGLIGQITWRNLSPRKT